MEISVFTVSDFALISFFQKIYSKVNAQLEILKRSPNKERVESVSKSCKQLHLLISLMNHNFCYITFSCKIACISSAIVTLFFAIKFSESSPLNAMLNLALALNQFGIFIVVFHKAFGIPDKMKELKDQILLVSARINSTFQQR
ncbi:unnamed protein product, partial [Allacma fusca]